MIDRQGDAIIPCSKHAWKIFRIDKIVPRSQLPFQPFLFVHRTQGVAHKFVIQTHSTGQQLIKGRSHILKIRQSLQIAIACGIKSKIQGFGLIKKQRLSILQTNGIAFSARFGGTEQIVKIGVIIFGREFPLPMMEIKSNVHSFIGWQISVRGIRSGEIKSAQSQLILKIKSHAHSCKVFVPLHNRIGRGEFDIFQGTVSPGNRVQLHGSGRTQCPGPNQFIFLGNFIPQKFDRADVFGRIDRNHDRHKSFAGVSKHKQRIA